jgi:nicotinamide-nucleotide amidase
MDNEFYTLASTLGMRLRQCGWQLALAESCTGGAIAKAVTDVPGSSAWFDRGFVTYSNAAKVDMLGVSQATLNAKGAVSEETALEMAEGALEHSQADLSMAVTGVAGPDGGSREKPVGTVFIAWQLRGQPGYCVKQQFSGDRRAVRSQTVLFCLKQVSRLAEAKK